MKQVSLILGIVVLLLVGWLVMRSQTPTPQPIVEEPETGVEPAEPAAPEAATPEEETEPLLVEESAGEEDEAEAEDQPIILAQADPTPPSTDWQFSEGRHFTRMVPTQPTVGGADKIEVAEFFWYGCNHCFDFEPYINRWAENVPDNVRFVRIPALWNPLVKLHGQLYYTEEVLANNGLLKDRAGFRSAVFLEYHRRGNRLASEGAIQALFERFGVSETDFKNAWGSFEVAQKIRVAEDLARRYGVASVPMMVVNGKYRTSGSEAGSYPKLLDVIDELVAREESLR